MSGKQELTKRIAKITAEIQDAQIELEEGTTEARAEQLKKLVERRTKEFNILSKEFTA